MKEKELTIIKYLKSQDDWRTSYTISTTLGISVRSVKSNIQDINRAHPDLIASSRKGFKLSDKDRLTKIIQIENNRLIPPQSAADRKKYILRKLLLEKEQYSMEQLADELSISYATLINELPSLKNQIASFDLIVKTKNDMIYISGPEEYKKKLISSLIYEDSKDAFLSIKLMQNYLPRFDLSKLRKIVFSVLRESHFFMDEFSLLNLVMHIAITMERNVLYGTRTFDKSELDESLINPDIRDMILNIASIIDEEYQLSFTNREIYDFCLMIMTRVIHDSSNDIKIENLSNVVGSKVTDLVFEMQNRMKESFNINMTNADFTVRFSLHLKNMLIRLENNILLRNPQLTDIKNSYPFIYDVSVYLANMITEDTGCPVSEDEISYIALHVGVLIDERKAIKHKVSAILLCPQYFFNSLDFTKRFHVIFKNDLYITAIISNEDELESYSDYDLILSTIPIYGYHSKPFIQFSWAIRNKDIVAISSKIEEIIKNRVKQKLEAKLKTLFRQEIFFVDKNFKNQDEAINTMTDALIAYDYADDAFKKKVFDREKISSSAYSNIAMPHPLEMNAFTSVIGVSLHPGGINWNGQKVNIIFLLAINSKDRLFFRNIFDFITEVISDTTKLKKILRTKSYDEFMDLLVSWTVKSI